MNYKQMNRAMPKNFDTVLLSVSKYTRLIVTNLQIVCSIH